MKEWDAHLAQLQGKKGALFGAAPLEALPLEGLVEVLPQVSVVAVLHDEVGGGGNGLVKRVEAAVISG